MSVRNRYMERVEWDRGAWLAFCVQQARSRIVSLAWMQGLDAHGETLEAGAPARKLAEMEIWLRRLTGKFRIEGKYWNSGGSSSVSGTADCFGIGSGPGASCVISTEWEAPNESSRDPRLDMALHNAMRGLVLLFGIDPGGSQVRATLVDFRAIRTSGFLDDGVVMLGSNPKLENMFIGKSLVTYTWVSTLVATKPGGDLTMKFLVRAADFRTTPYPILFDLQLHRELPVRAQ